MARLTKVTVAGTDVSNYLTNYSIDDSIDDEYTVGRIELIRTVTDILTPEVGDEVIITRGLVVNTEQTIFKGNIAKTSEMKPFLSLTVNDKLWILDRIEVTKSYDLNIDSQSGVISAIAQDLIETYGGMTADVTASGAVLVLDKFICDHDKIFEQLRELKNFLGWMVFYNPADDKIHFEPEGTTSYAVNLSTETNLLTVPEWQTDYEQMINKVTVIGASREAETTEFFNGDAVEDTFALTHVPKSVKVYVGNANYVPGAGTRPSDDEDFLQIEGKLNSTAGAYNYTVDDDAEVKSVIFEAGSIPSANNNNVEIRYSYLIPTPVQVLNAASITSYGTFEQSKVIQNLKSVADAEKKATKIIDTFSLPFVRSTNLQVKDTGFIQAGYKVHVIDTVQNIERDLIVRKIRYLYPEDFDEVEVGDKTWKIDRFLYDIDERLRLIEKSQLKNPGILTLVRSDITETTVQQRYLQAQSSTIGDAFIIGHPVNGIIGTSKLGAGTMSAYSTIMVTHPTRTYTELFYDEDFEDATSTATWDTANKRIDYTNGQVTLSEPIALGVGTIIAATLTVTNTGTLVYELSADGGANWDTVTSGVRNVFGNTGTELLWRATSTGVSQLTALEILWEV